MKDEMREYLTRYKAKQKADSTIRNLRIGLEAFSDWLDRGDLEVDDVSKRDIENYLVHMKDEKGYASSTMRIRFTAVSQFYKDYTENGYEANDPTDPVSVTDYAPAETKIEQETKERHVWLEKDEVKQLVENVPAPNLRNRLVVLFTYYTGLRRQEVVDVKIEDLDRENRRVTVRGKGSKNNTAHWQPKLDGLLNAWLDGGYRGGSPYATESDYLFVTQSTSKLSANRLSRIVRNAAKNAGIQEVLYRDANDSPRYKYTTHTLRHSFAMHYLQNGGSMEGLSKLLAHSDIETTQKYGEILEERAKEEYDQYAPQIDL